MLCGVYFLRTLKRKNTGQKCKCQKKRSFCPNFSLKWKKRKSGFFRKKRFSTFAFGHNVENLWVNTLSATEKQWKSRFFDKKFSTFSTNKIVENKKHKLANGFKNIGIWVKKQSSEKPIFASNVCRLVVAMNICVVKNTKRSEACINEVKNAGT